MIDTTETAPKPTEPQPEGNDTSEAPNATQAPTGGQERANAEAAGYRRRLREAEAERDQLKSDYDTRIGTLQQQLAGLQRAEVERIAGQHLQSGSDVWRHDDTDLAGMLGDDGRVDAAKVQDAARNVAAAHPHWRRASSTERTTSVRGNGRIGGGDARPVFSDAFGPKKQ